MAGGEPCHEKYVFIGRSGKGWHGWEEGADGRCECRAWCEKLGYGSDCRGTPGDGDGEQWAPSDDLQAIIDRLLARIDELLGYETGLSEEELQMIINRMTGVKSHIILTHNSHIKLPDFSHSLNKVR